MNNVFVVGCGHTGTSIVTRILSSHPDIYVVPRETGWFFSQDLESINKEILKEERKSIKKEKSFCVEKTPRHILSVDNIWKLRPKSKIIICVRDPRDMACSYKERGFSFFDGLKRWRDSYMSIKSYLDNDLVHVVKLEDLIDSPDIVVSEILEFLGLKKQSLLNYYKKPQSWYTNCVVKDKPKGGLGEDHEKLRNWQINQPLFKSSQRYKTDMTFLDQCLFWLFRPFIGSLCRYFGYILIFLIFFNCLNGASVGNYLGMV